MTEKTQQLSPRMSEAMKLAFNLHGRDFRKSSNVPVFAHLLSVCALVLYNGGGEDEAIAALLHDSLEDKPEIISREDKKKQFGESVLKLIEVSTDTAAGYSGGPKGDWRQRKEAYLDHARLTNPNLLLVIVADKVDNTRAMLADYQLVGYKLWERFNAKQADQIWYYQQSVKAYKEAGFQSALLNDLEQLVEQLSSLPRNNN
jgi:(p)ppGpp synthase/HD superfamily hydrolase